VLHVGVHVMYPRHGAADQRDRRGGNLGRVRAGRTRARRQVAGGDQVVEDLELGDRGGGLGPCARLPRASADQPQISSVNAICSAGPACVAYVV
jgi:hypothetical protein